VETFSQRAQEMGLDISKAYKGMYSYEDRFCEVVYRQPFTQAAPGNPAVKEDLTDDIPFPYYGVFTRYPQLLDYNYIGYVSQIYKFVGNDILTQTIKDSITSSGNALLHENQIFAPFRSTMRNELILQSGQQVAVAGDVLPLMVVNNSYNGTRAASLSFGIATLWNTNYITYSFKLGEMRMVHIAGSQTSMATPVTEYVETFQENITDMITQSFEKRISEVEMLSTLDLIEAIGKKRREKIADLLSDPQNLTAWGLFLAIVKYSSFEPNLNVKRMLENIAQSVLVIPARMYDVLEKLESQ